MLNWDNDLFLLFDGIVDKEKKVLKPWQKWNDSIPFNVLSSQNCSEMIVFLGKVREPLLNGNSTVDLLSNIGCFV